MDYSYLFVPQGRKKKVGDQNFFPHKNSDANAFVPFHAFLRARILSYCSRNISVGDEAALEISSSGFGDSGQVVRLLLMSSRAQALTRLRPCPHLDS
ncbi:hypothetical protein JTE90_024087 [Oedothorax gibbosus]|uniref:Uncharacterized protein n=1 Tax=Oedothorax gibbosus TaxID=931172 RepID=A0AAV6UUB1_9ARAC|nr:hypothetical protein JTE90_024087 [Oedothorax gibbosus]